jgi:hypothetical protein
MGLPTQTRSLAPIFRAAETPPGLLGGKGGGRDNEMRALERGSAFVALAPKGACCHAQPIIHEA